jgi:23S rRNA (uracil1939-C5)-methyltransferase
MPLTHPAINDLIEGKIEQIAFGGEGILRYRGFVIFVPFTSPGDLITCRITELKKSFAKAELVSIQTPSPYRAIPPCPYFGTCGGCQIQHLNEQEQLIYKKHAVTDALKRIGHLNVRSVSIVPAHLKWAYRRHITLHLKPQSGTFEAGYIAIDNKSLVVIEICPIFNKEQDLIIDQIQHFVHTLPNPKQQEGRVTILKNHRGQYILSFQFEPSFLIEESYFKQALQQYPTFAGILVNNLKRQWVIGDPYSEQTLEGLTFRFTPQAFIQNHPEQSANIYRHICSLVNGHIKRKILDLYCGFGMTSLLLAHHGHLVTGIEYNPEAITFAQENVRLNKLQQVHFFQGDVEKLFPKLIKELKPNLVLMNPPRAGISKNVIQHLLNYCPQEIIYVSCMPSTLARDLAKLCQEKYQIQECMVYDMFPQTAHVETLIYLKSI